MRFLKNDRVRIIASEEQLIERNVEDTLLSGRTGIVVSIRGVSPKTIYTVRVDGIDWEYYEQDLELNELDCPKGVNADQGRLTPVSHKDYMLLSDAYDKHSKDLMNLKGEEYAIDGDFLAMENRLAGMLGDTPEYVSLVMAGKHITALGIILEKNDSDKIKLAKLDERVRDATNLLKIMAAFIHAKQDDFSLHLGKEEKTDRTASTPAPMSVDGEVCH